MKTINFKEVMAARAKAASVGGDPAGAPATPAPVADPAATRTVRSFTAEGIARVTDLLREMRLAGKVLQEDVDELVSDIEYTREVDPSLKIDPDRIFATKLELCEYFTKVFTPEFLAAHRKDKGLWTWLAMAYFQQFVKTGKDVVRIVTDARWVFSPDVYRLARRHFVAGPLYLFVSLPRHDEQADELLFDGPVCELSRIVDVLTYLPECVRAPAFLQAAVELYYDGSRSSKIKRLTFNKKNAASVWQYIRVFQQLRETRDFFDRDDVEELLSILPRQFDILKAAS